MFNKKVFLVVICTVLFFGNQSYCFGKKAQEISTFEIAKVVGSITFEMAKEAGSITAEIFAAYCADKILNKSKYYHDNLDGKVKTFAVAIGALNLTIELSHILRIFCNIKKIELTQGENEFKLLLSMPVVIVLNYYIDKILNGNEYYHGKVDPYVKKVCLAYGGGRTFYIFFNITKGLICFLAS